jgi:hypothetical protein
LYFIPHPTFLYILLLLLGPDLFVIVTPLLVVYHYFRYIEEGGNSYMTQKDI